MGWLVRMEFQLLPRAGGRSTGANIETKLGQNGCQALEKGPI